MADPKDLAEYNERFFKNHRITGFGIDNVRSHIPCPFCGAADWVVFKIMDTEKAMENGAVCKECHRGAKAITSKTASSIAFEVVQTVGADPPPFLPHMRRLEGS